MSILTSEPKLYTAESSTRVSINAISKIYDGSNFALIDPVSKLLGTVEIEHFKVHSGTFYTCSDYATIGTGITKYWRFTAPNTTTRIHFKVSALCSSSSTTFFYENPTLNTTGTILTSYNNDRNSTNTTTFGIAKDPTIITAGTLLTVKPIGGNGGVYRSSGESRPGSEFILKQNTTYLLSILSGTADNTVGMTTEYYEV